MNNYLDLLDTELTLTVSVNGQVRSRRLQQPMAFSVTDSVTVDGIEILPKYQHLAKGNALIVDEPFYQWYHRVSGQGWLLKPQ